jgi:hypothetical protein
MGDACEFHSEIFKLFVLYVSYSFWHFALQISDGGNTTFVYVIIDKKT